MSEISNAALRNTAESFIRKGEVFSKPPLLSEALQDHNDTAGSEVDLPQPALSLHQKHSQLERGCLCSKMHLHDAGFIFLSSLSQAMWHQ